jgi:hypothetical protein
VDLRCNNRCFVSYHCGTCEASSCSSSHSYITSKVLCELRLSNTCRCQILSEMWGRTDVAVHTSLLRCMLGYAWNSFAIGHQFYASLLLV